MIKRLSQCIREYKKDAILSPLYVLVESLLDVAIPFVMAGLIDKGIEAGNMSMIVAASTCTSPRSSAPWPERTPRERHQGWRPISEKGYI